MIREVGNLLLKRDEDSEATKGFAVCSGKGDKTKVSQTWTNEAGAKGQAEALTKITGEEHRVEPVWLFNKRRK